MKISIKLCIIRTLRSRKLYLIGRPRRQNFVAGCLDLAPIVKHPPIGRFAPRSGRTVARRYGRFSISGRGEALAEEGTPARQGPSFRTESYR